MSKAKILIIEDDASLVDVLEYNLRQSGYEVSLARDGRYGLDRAHVMMPDLVVLDIMLPVIDGHEVCRRLRADAATKDMLILMLTAKSEEVDQMVGFSLGADDYVTKPFSVKVLLQRIKALLRRRERFDEATDVVSCHNVVIDRKRHRATAGSEPLELTRSEFRLLESLVRQPGRAFSRTELIDAALGEDVMILERTIDVHIRALRRKLGDFSELVETVRGVGYRFRDSRGE